MRTYPTTHRGFVEILTAVGAVVVRRKGSHEQWRLPNGRTFTIVTAREGYTGRSAVNRWTELKRLYPEIRSAPDGTR